MVTTRFARILSKRYAVFLSDAFFKKHGTIFKKTLSKPLPAGTEVNDFSNVLAENILPLLPAFFEEFKRLVPNNPSVLKAVQDRVDLGTEYLISLSQSIYSQKWYSFNTPEDYLRYVAGDVISRKILSRVKKIGDILKYEWAVSEPTINRVIVSSLKKASPEELSSLTSDSYRDFDIKTRYLERIKFEENILKALKKTILTWDPMAWLSRVRTLLDLYHSEEALERSSGHRDFDMYGMKVVVEDTNLNSRQIREYIGLLDYTYSLLRKHGFDSAWYGSVLIQCESCGGLNQNTQTYDVGADYSWLKDVVRVFVRPESQVVYIMLHELGHRYWFKQMSRSQRLRFGDLVKVKTLPKPKGGLLNLEDLLSKVKKPDLGVSENSPANFQSQRKVLRDYEVAVYTAMQGLPIPTEVQSNLDKISELEDIWYRDVENYSVWFATCSAIMTEIAEQSEHFLKTFVDRANKSYLEALAEWEQSYNQAPIPSVSKYGESNIDEAFAEVFAYYVSGRSDLTREQAESFLAILKG